MNPFLEYRNWPVPGLYVKMTKLKLAVLFAVVGWAWVRLQILWSEVRKEISRQWEGGKK